jgi:hypothetical protein
VKTLVVLFVSLPALARPGPSPKVLGWSGATLAYVAPPEEVGLSDFGGTGTVTYGVLLDGRTGFSQRYFLRSDGEVPKEDKQQLQKLPKKTDWDAWLAAHPVSCGAGEAEVTLKGRGVSGKAKKSGYAFESSADDADEKKASFVAAVKGKPPSVEWSLAGPSGGGSLSGHVLSCFSEKRVAWIVVRDTGMMRDPGEFLILVGPNGTPRIQLVADKSILADAAAKVGAALETAGFVTTNSKASNEKTPRAATVIYAAAGFEALAQKLAAAVPGGASVAKLDWKAPFEIVVGIGATALH